MSRRPTSSTLEILKQIIGFDTVSRHSNLAMIDWIQRYLEGHGIGSTLIHDATGKKANLYATIGAHDRPGILLSGHTDVVPVDGQDWSTDPFDLVEKDGRLFGRGTSDMKSFLAVVLSQVPAFTSARLDTPINLAFTYDEEVGCQGAPSLLEHITRLPTRPRYAVIGEPTNMKVITAHKGNKRYRCEVHGHESHSALANRGVNAIEIAADLVYRLRTMARQRAESGPFDRGFDPPYTTIHTGTIQGGTAMNIVPKHCVFEFEFRFIPGDDPLKYLDSLKERAQLLEQEMKGVAADARIDFLFKSEYPALSTEETAEITSLAKSLSGSNDTGKVAFGTEGGLFQEAGLPTVICGPGSIEQAHKPDEWITLEQIALCEDFMQRLVGRLAAGRAAD
jgi:acetylornithine deacetylase